MSCRCEVYASQAAAKDLTEDDINRYYQLDIELMPEALPQFYKSSILEKGGCKGLQVRTSVRVSSRFAAINIIVGKYAGF